jgi:hypothetical protein
MNLSREMKWILQMLSLYSRTTKLKEAWSHTAFRADYERIVRTVCGK